MKNLSKLNLFRPGRQNLGNAPTIPSSLVFSPDRVESRYSHRSRGNVAFALACIAFQGKASQTPRATPCGESLRGLSTRPLPRMIFAGRLAHTLQSDSGPASPRRSFH